MTRSMPSTCWQNWITGAQAMPLEVMGMFCLIYSLTVRFSFGMCGKRLLIA